MNCSECRSDGTIQCIACLRGRLRETAQILIEEVGATGGHNAEDVARLAVAQIRVARDRADRNQAGYDRVRREQNRVVAAEDLGQVATRMEEENWATDASAVRSAMHELERLRREIEEVRSAVCADDTETTAEAALHLAQAAEKKGRADAIQVQVERLSVGPTDVLLVRPNLGDLPSREAGRYMEWVRTDLVALLEQIGVQHGGIVVLAPGWEVSAVPREDLRVLLDGDPAARVDRAAEAIFQKNFSASSITGPWRTMSRQLAEVALAAAEGEHVCAAGDRPRTWVASRMVTLHDLGRVARFAVNGRFVALPHTVHEGDTIWATGVPEADAILAGAFGDSGEGL